VLGPDPLTATSLDNLAGLRTAQGDLEGAGPLYERALTIREKVLGLEHQDTGTVLNNIGGLLYGQGEFSAAQQLFEHALAINEKALGAEHPATATVRENLAKLRRRGA